MATAVAQHYNLTASTFSEFNCTGHLTEETSRRHEAAVQVVK